MSCAPSNNYLLSQFLGILKHVSVGSSELVALCNAARANSGVQLGTQSWQGTKASNSSCLLAKIIGHVAAPTQAMLPSFGAQALFTIPGTDMRKRLSSEEAKLDGALESEMIGEMSSQPCRI